MTDIYADGIGNVRLAGTNARIDLVGDQPDRKAIAEKSRANNTFTRVNSKYTNTKRFRPTTEKNKNQANLTK